MSDDFRARLRRLRREQPGPAQPSPEAPAPERRPELPAWMRARLARAGGPAEESRAAGERCPPRGLEELSGGASARITRFPASHRHGGWTLASALDADPEVLARLSGDRSLGRFDPSRAVYLDIETTGLSGGAGTWPYLVALGRFDGDGFELWQGFMRGPEDEPALMAEVARRVREAGQLVTFFGKSFDRHRLEDKMRVCAVAPPFEGAPHLDLFHVCRRLYGGAYPDGRLQTMERSLCGVARDDDLPGSFAPAAWFDYLAGRPHRLEQVFRHNLDDVLSLAVLTAHVASSFEERSPDGAPLEGHGAQRALGLAKLCASAGDPARAVQWYERALVRLDVAAPAAHRREIQHALARSLEREGATDRALDLHLELARGRDRAAVWSGIRAAIVLERVGRVAEALECAQAALDGADRFTLGAERARLMGELERRVARLRKRVAPLHGA